MLSTCGGLSPEDMNLLTASKSENEKREIEEVDKPIAKTMSGLVTTVKLLQSKCRIKDGMIATLAEALRKNGTPEQTERILKNLENPERQVDDFDRSELWKCLGLGNSNQRDIQQETETSKGQLLTVVLVLFIITLSHVYRNHGYLILFSCCQNLQLLFTNVLLLSDKISIAFLNLFSHSIELVKDYNREINLEAIEIFNRVIFILGKYFKFLSYHLTSVGAIFGTVSFIKTLWSLGKKTGIWYRKSSSSSHDSTWIGKLCKYIKSFGARTVAFLKSQYHLFYYATFLSLGFLASKTSRFVENWSQISEEGQIYDRISE